MGIKELHIYSKTAKMSIKEILVLSIFICFVALFSNSALAGNEGYVNIAIADAPPRILGIAVKPEIAYTGSEVSCEAEVYDENLSLLRLEYEWHINGKAVSGKEKQLTETIQAGDEIECKIIAVDLYGKSSEAESEGIKIQPKGILQATGYAISNINNKPEAGRNFGGITLLGVVLITGLGFFILIKFS